MFTTIFTHVYYGQVFGLTFTSTSIEYLVMQPIEQNEKFGAEYEVISFELATDELLSALQFLDTVEYHVLCILYLVSRPQAETTKVPKSFLYPPVRELQVHPSAIHGQVRGHSRGDGNPRPTKLSKVQDSKKNLLNEAVDTYGVRNLFKQVLYPQW